MGSDESPPPGPRSGPQTSKALFRKLRLFSPVNWESNLQTLKLGRNIDRGLEAGTAYFVVFRLTLNGPTIERRS
ncbi:MAG: hypothetical protein QOG92_301 [Verrucomicrobiota bacterium]|jgi:hypothetical protein|nr:hypothetical protein [Verrucomicrobiota bacterium]